MWHAIIWLAPQRDAAFLVVANSGGAFAACDEVIGKLIKIFDQRQRQQSRPRFKTELPAPNGLRFRRLS